MTHLVVGYGEVGQAVQKLLKCNALDSLSPLVRHDGFLKKGPRKYDVLHICFPYSKDFVKLVKNYEKEFSAKLVIIHSTVPVGTSAECDAVHSPIRGVHPHLFKGLRTFVKYFGGKRAVEAANIFKIFGIRVKAVDNSDTTEALKLWDTTQYGLLIQQNKLIHAWCKENGLDFDIIYTDANKTYNEGYTRLGRPDVVRPYLKYVDGKIGGHCVIPNGYLLSKQIGKGLEAF